LRAASVFDHERIAQLIDPEALEVPSRVSTAQYARLLDERRQLCAMGRCG